MPPEAFTPISPTVCFINDTSSTVAPPLLKPVEVFTKATPIALQISHALTISSVVSKQVSKITLSGVPWQALNTA